MPEGDNTTDWVRAQWRAICEQSPAHMAVFDRESRFVAASRTWIDDFEGGGDNLAGRCYFDLHPDAPERWQAIHQRVLGGEICREDGERFLLDGGKQFWTCWVCAPWRTPDGEIGGYVVNVQNATPVMIAQRDLVAAKQELHLALDAARAGIWEINLSTLATKWSAEIWRLYGLDPAQLAASPASWAQSIVPEEREHLYRTTLEAMMRHEEIEVEWRVNLPDEERWLLARGRPVREHDGSIERYIGVVVDVTAQRLLACDAERQARELSTILDALPVGVARVDRDLRYRFVNRLYEDYFARPSSEIIGQQFAHLLAPETIAQVLPCLERVLAGTPETREADVHFADGRWRTLRVSLLPEFSVGGEVVGFYVVSSDITSLRETEAELGQVRDKLDLLTRREIAHQTLVAVAHELRQPLHAAAVFAAATRAIADGLPSGSELPHAVSRTVREIRRANDMLTRLFASLRAAGSENGSEGGGEGGGGRERIDLNHLLQRVVAQWKSQAGQVRCLSLLLEKAPLRIEVNPMLVEKILINLLRNAAEATGCIDGCADAARITLTTFERDEQACVCVEDSGGGVSPAMRAHLFEPFRTGKANGLGLGLSIAQRLAEQERGRIWHEDRPGGSAFCLAIPLSP